MVCGLLLRFRMCMAGQYEAGRQAEMRNEAELNLGHNLVCEEKN